MNAENMNQILDELATRFGATGAELWEQLVRHEGAYHALGIVMGVLLLVICYRVGRWAYARDYEGEAWVLLMLAAILLGVLGLAGIILDIHGLAMWLIAPDAATLKGLLP